MMRKIIFKLGSTLVIFCHFPAIILLFESQIFVDLLYSNYFLDSQFCLPVQGVNPSILIKKLFWHIPKLSVCAKGQLISKCIFLHFLPKKGTKTSRQVVKLNLFVGFFEETSASKNNFKLV